MLLIKQVIYLSGCIKNSNPVGFWNGILHSLNVNFIFERSLGKAGDTVNVKEWCVPDPPPKLFRQS